MNDKTTVEQDSVLVVDLAPEQTTVKIVAVIDLGANNKGQISAADLSAEERAHLVNDAAKAKYKKPATKLFRCIDGRIPEGGLIPEKGMADPQSAGGIISDVVADFMANEKPPLLSEVLAQNLRINIKHGYPPVVHGDNHKRKEGCGADLLRRQILHSNAENKAIIVPKAWFLAQRLGLDEWLDESDLLRLIDTGKERAGRNELWDLSVEQTVDAAVTQGAKYEELIEDHRERLIVIDLSEEAFDEQQFMNDHVKDGRPLEAFVISAGAIKAKLFDIAAQNGQNEKSAALKTAAVLLFNIGAGKELTADESKEPGTALPVVVIDKATA